MPTLTRKAPGPDDWVEVDDWTPAAADDWTEDASPEQPPATAAAPEEAQLWDIWGDIGRAAGESWGALKRDAAAVATEIMPPAQPAEPIGFLPGVLEEAASTGRGMMAAGRVVGDVAGLVSSPITGLTRATLGSALSYLPFVDKKEADEAIDTALMAVRPGRGGALRQAPDAPGAPDIPAPAAAVDDWVPASEATPDAPLSAAVEPADLAAPVQEMAPDLPGPAPKGAPIDDWLPDGADATSPSATLPASPQPAPPPAEIISPPRGTGNIAPPPSAELQGRTLKAAGDLPADPAPIRAGNLNLARIETSNDVRSVLSEIATEYRGFDPARRGVQSNETTAQLADQLGMSVDDLLSRRRGQAFNAEEALAARQVLAASGDNLVDLARSAHGGTDEALVAFREALARHTLIQEQVAGFTAEAGRTLQQYRIAAKATAGRDRLLKDLIATAGGRDNLEGLADAITALEDPAQLNTFVRQAAKAKTSDMLMEAWINGLLSGPKTHAVNITSNLLTQLWQIPENAVAAGIGAVRGGPDRIPPAEPITRLWGFVTGARDGLVAAGKVLRTGEPLDPISKIEMRKYRAIPGPAGEAIRIPGRFLMAEDELFRTIGYRSELNAQALRIARAEGKRGQALADRVAELRNNPTDAMMDRARDFARYSTFQAPLGKGGQALMDLSNSHPAAKVVLPFVRTPINIMKFAAERSPFGLLMKDVRADLSGANGKIPRDVAQARMALGTATGAAVASLALEGRITGGGPADPREAAALRATGWQPYSVKIGGAYYSYARLDPLATTIGVAADMAEVSKEMGQPESDKVAAMIVASLSRNLVNKTYLSGLSDLIQAVQDPERYGERWVQSLAGSAIPTVSAQVAREADPYLREARTILDTFRSRIPGLSQSLPPRRDIWGQPIRLEGGIGPDLMSPIAVSASRDDATTNELVRLGIAPSNPPRKLRGVELSAEQYDRFASRAGQTAKSNLDRLTMTPSYQALPDFAKGRVFRSIIAGARQQALAELMAADPALVAAIGTAKVEELLTP